MSKNKKDKLYVKLECPNIGYEVYETTNIIKFKVVKIIIHKELPKDIREELKDKIICSQTLITFNKYICYIKFEHITEYKTYEYIKEIIREQIINEILE